MVTQEEPLELESGTVALYFMACYEGWEQSLGEYGDVSGATYGVFRLLPETGEITLLEEQAAASYANTRLFPYTADGRLFLVDCGEVSATFEERNPVNNERTDGYAYVTHREDYPSWEDFTIAGDYLYYRPADTVWSDSTLYRLELKRDAWDDYLLPDNDPANTGFLRGAAGNLYRVHMPNERNGHIIEVYRCEMETGENAELITRLQVSSPDDYSGWQVTLDQTAIWMGAFNEAAMELNVWRIGLDAPPGSDPELVITYPPVSTASSYRIDSIDADSGYLSVVMMGGWPDWDRWLFLYDHNTDAYTVSQPEHDTDQMEILVVR